MELGRDSDTGGQVNLVSRYPFVLLSFITFPILNTESFYFWIMLINFYMEVYKLL